MGLFDFFRRRPTAERTPDRVPLPEPRCHHYTLAHLALRDAAFQHPVAFLGLLASPRAQAFLTEVYRSVEDHCREREPRPSFGPEDLKIHTVRAGRYPCAVVEMPAPRSAAEAYFVAAVLLADPAEELPDPKDVQLRYFTLEEGFVFPGAPPRTVLAEWTADRTHVNFGDGPPPQVTAFVAAIEGKLPESR
jgi:hypothetical protein